MRSSRRGMAGVVAVVLAALAGTLAPAPAQGGTTMLASVSVQGHDATGESIGRELSADGTMVVFSSTDRNLVSGDHDRVSDIYVKDLVTGDVSLASTRQDGTKANGGSHWPDISADGTKVAFRSVATNLDVRDRDGFNDIYVKDLVTGNLTLVSVSDTGVKGNADSLDPNLSADGAIVAFDSFSTNLDPRDARSDRDVYVKRLATSDLELASTNRFGVKGNRWSFDANMSADGSLVAFQTGSSNLSPQDGDKNRDVYVKDLVTGTIALASITADGVKGNQMSLDPYLSGNGSRVVFVSQATNLSPLDGDRKSDVYVKDLDSGSLTLASTAAAGAKGNGDNFEPSISDYGIVVFSSAATNLVPADVDPDGDVYAKDLASGEVGLLSVSDLGTKGDGSSGNPSIARGGSVVGFTSGATNLDPRDTDPKYDVYVATPDL